MRSTPEHELVERCRQGDEAAFRDLVDQYKGLVFALIAPVFSQMALVTIPLWLRLAVRRAERRLAAASD